LFHVRKKPSSWTKTKKLNFIHSLQSFFTWQSELGLTFCSRSPSSAPDTDDRKKLERVFRYLNGSRELGIVLETSKDPIVEGYIDASYGVHADCRSHTGMLITLPAGRSQVQAEAQYKGF